MFFTSLSRISEEEIPKRIRIESDEHCMGDIYSLSKEDYLKKIEKIRKKTIGKLIIKQYTYWCR